jgi:hypothetical protein
MEFRNPAFDLQVFTAKGIFRESVSGLLGDVVVEIFGSVAHGRDVAVNGFADLLSGFLTVVAVACTAGKLPACGPKEPFPHFMDANADFHEIPLRLIIYT